MKLNDKEVEILNEDLALKTQVSAEETQPEIIWPEHYETYLGDGIYLGCS